MAVLAASAAVRMAWRVLAPPQRAVIAGGERDIQGGGGGQQQR
jgi:hypothetical protein